MITALCVGLVVGFVLAIPPGPITIACIRQALAGQTREGVALALAASAMDILYGFPEEYAKFLVVAVPWVISGTGASHLLMPLTT